MSAGEPPTFTCPRCGMTSHNPTDVRERYCGNCHDWTGSTHDHIAIEAQMMGGDLIWAPYEDDRK